MDRRGPGTHPRRNGRVAHGLREDPSLARPALALCPALRGENWLLSCQQGPRKQRPAPASPGHQPVASAQAGSKSFFGSRPMFSGRSEARTLGSLSAHLNGRYTRGMIVFFNACSTTGNPRVNLASSMSRTTNGATIVGSPLEGEEIGFSTQAHFKGGFDVYQDGKFIEHMNQQTRPADLPVPPSPGRVELVK